MLINKVMTVASFFNSIISNKKWILQKYAMLYDIHQNNTLTMAILKYEGYGMWALIWLET